MGHCESGLWILDPFIHLKIKSQPEIDLGILSRNVLWKIFLTLTEKGLLHIDHGLQMIDEAQR